ncbi:hypothetical protein BJX76DRAFT_116906 [Aspergillus varians]
MSDVTDTPRFVSFLLSGSLVFLSVSKTVLLCFTCSKVSVRSRWCITEIGWKFRFSFLFFFLPLSFNFPLLSTLSLTGDAHQ